MLAGEEEVASPSTATATTREHQQQPEQKGEENDGYCCRWSYPEIEAVLTAMTRATSMAKQLHRTPRPSKQQPSTVDGDEKDPSEVVE